MPFLRLLVIITIFAYSQGIGAENVQHNNTTKPTLSFTQAETDWLKQHKTIRFTADPNWLPYGEFTSTGEYKGIIAILIAHLSKQTGITFEAVPSKNSTDVLRKIQNGSVDIIVADTADITISTTHEFTKPYLQRQLAIVTHRDRSEFIDDIYALKEKEIALMKGTGYPLEAIKQYPDIDFVETTSIEEGLKKLNNKTVDAFIISNTRARFHLKKPSFHSLHIAGQLPLSMKIGFAVRQDWPELLSILNKGQQTLLAFKQQRLVKTWMEENQPSSNNYSWVWKVILALSLLVFTASAVSLSWYLRCQKTQLKNRKKQLNVRKKRLNMRQERITELNQRFELASKAAAIGVWELVIEDKDQLKLHFNPEMRHIHGLPKKDDIPIEQWLESIHPDDHQLIKDSIQALYNDNKNNHHGKTIARSIEYRTIHTNNEIRYTHASSTLVNGVGNEPDKLYGISWDITIRKRAEEKVRELSRVAQQASRAKGRFLANMSHEIRTPMNAVMGLTHLALQVQPRPRAQVREYLHKIQDSSSSLLGIINDILDFSKIEAGKLHIDNAPFDTTAVFDRLSSLTTIEAHNKKLKRSISIDPNIPRWLIGDSLRLGQVLLNLTQNAIKFTPKGQVTVTASLEKSDEQCITIHFSVKDTGIGIKKKQLDILFQPFEQAEVSTSRRFGGTGLGLSISQHLIEQMGGKIGVRSKIDKGTEFFFTLPFQRASVEQQKVQEDTHDLVINDNDLSGNVLVVEDNAINQEIARGLLTHIGLTVSIATNGREGVAAVETDHFDLILMDIQMPEMDGLTACKYIRRQHPANKLPIIAMTADAMEGDEAKSLAAGMNAHLSKPIDPNVLYQTLAKFLDKKPAKKKQLPLIDLDKGLRRVAGNGELLEKIWRRFKKEHAGDIRKLRIAIENNQRDEERRLIHTLKGVTGNIGAEQLYQRIKKIGKKQPTEEQLKELETLLIRTLLEIETHLEANAM